MTAINVSIIYNPHCMSKFMFVFAVFVVS